MKSASLFRMRMSKLIDRAGELLKDPNVGADKHWSVCQKLADEYELWEGSPANGYHFPTWLSRVVAGMMSDLGIES